MKRGDLILIGVLLLLALIGMGVFALIEEINDRGDAMWYAVVEVEGEIIHRLPLSEDTELRIEAGGGYNLLTVKDGQVRIREADCDNQVCVHTGSIDREMNAASILCSPHGVLVYLEKGKA
jgi:hypothetical protein